MRPPRVTSSRVVYENRWIRLHEERLELADGTPGLYGWLEMSPSALIVPVQDGFVWLVEQYRHPIGERLLEFSQGAWEHAPDASAEELARGELAEETGLRAATMERLGRLYFAPGITNQFVDVWLATGLEPGEQALEATEQGLTVHRVTIAEVDRMVRENEIVDAASVAAWHLVKTRL